MEMQWLEWTVSSELLIVWEILKLSYHLEFMGGADLKFAGKGKFFKSHGFDSVLGEKLIILSGRPKLHEQLGCL